MSDPKRLIDSEAGMARDILHAASRQTASDSTLQNVLQLVDLALQQKAAGSREASSHALSAPRSLQSGRAPLARLQARPPLRGWLRFGLALELSALVPMGVAMAAGIGGTVLVARVVEHVQSIRAEPIENPASAAQREQRRPGKAAPLATPDAPQPAVNVASLPVEQLPLHMNATPGSPPPASPGVEDDWLGEQFTMLARARRILDAGNPAEALEILEDYARRFPEGTLGPQVAELRLRANATERRQGRTKSSTLKFD